MSRDMDYELKQQAEGAERQRRLSMEKEDVSGHGMIHGTQDTAGSVNQIMDKHLLVKLLHQRAHEMQVQSRGIQRLAELVSAAGPHDFDLFSVLFTVLKVR